MKCTKRSRILKCTGLLGLLGAALFFSGCHNRTFEEKAEWFSEKVSDKLDLNEKQQVKLKTLTEQVIAAKSRNSDQRADFFTEIKNLMISEKIKLAQITALIDEKRRLHDQEVPKIFPYLQDFHSSLSAEQKNKVIELMELFHKKHCGRH